MYASSAPKLSALVRRDGVGLPASYRQFLTFTDRTDLLALADAAEVTRKVTGTYSSATGQRLHDFALTPNVFRHDAQEVLTVKISNKGSRAAGNVKVFFPTPGFAEIEQDGAASRTEQTAGWIELKTLEPSGVSTVRFWGVGYAPERNIRVQSDEGITPVNAWIESVEDQPWQLRLGFVPLLFIVWLAGIIILTLGRVMSRNARS
jgi:hypothetical protein